MGTPAAKMGDTIVAQDLHLVVLPPPALPALLPHPFNGRLSGGLSADVHVMGRPAATVGSTATNQPPHVPPPAGPFQRAPSNQGTVVQGSATVFVNGRPAARAGDAALTCNDPADLPIGRVQAAGTVFIG